jgi:hypothetical protein
VSLLTARELSAWRDGLLRDGMKPATVVRLGRAVKAALNLAARRDPTIKNRAAWADGLSGVSEDFTSRNIERLNDDQTRALIAASYALDPNLGLYVEVAAETGARPSQIARLTVGDLQDGNAPRLMSPLPARGAAASRASTRSPSPSSSQRSSPPFLNPMRRCFSGPMADAGRAAILVTTCVCLRGPPPVSASMCRFTRCAIPRS